MLLSLFLLLVGLVVVVKGADFLINGASSLAKRFEVSEMVIGLTIVSMGTSAPEMIVNIFSSLEGKSELLMGNIIGSNIFNTALILGVAGMIYPLTVQRNSVRKEIPYSLFALAMLFFMVNDHLFSPTAQNLLSRTDASILLVFFVVFMIYTYSLSKQKPPESEAVKILGMGLSWLYILLGFGGLFLGGKLVVDNAVEIARMLHVSEKLIGLTIISIGTSLPELATSAMAAYKRRCDLAVGNVVGSNIFNILLILGVNGNIRPIEYDRVFNTDLLVLTGTTLVLVIAMFTLKKRKLDRGEAFFLLLVYVSYTAFIIIRK